MTVLVRLVALPAVAFGLGLSAILSGESMVEPPIRKGTSLPVPDMEVVARADIVLEDVLPDAALAVYDSASPRIYLHRRLLAQMGPALSAFLVAHEQGHLAYHHARRHRFGIEPLDTPIGTLWAYEFEADCYAVRALKRERPDAIVAAVRFFQHRTTTPTDREHPPMGARADSLLTCLAVAG